MRDGKRDLDQIMEDAGYSSAELPEPKYNVTQETQADE